MGLTFFLADLATPAIVIVLLGPLALYLIARWRATAGDSQLGLKFVLYYFSTLAFHVTLIGATLLIYALITPMTSSRLGGDDIHRMGFGFIVPGAIVLGVHLAYLVRTNDAQHIGIRRLFLGFNLVIAGFVGFAALIVGFQAMFAKGSTHGIGHLGGSGVVIYGAAWVLVAWQFSLTGGNPYQPIPEVVPPPEQTSPMQAARSTPGLPPLGGGAFPPIDR